MAVTRPIPNFYMIRLLLFPTFTMAHSASSLRPRDFTQDPWDQYPWPGFDPVANDLDIGRHTLPPLVARSKKEAEYHWGASVWLYPLFALDTSSVPLLEAPVAVRKLKAKKSLQVYVKWAGYCPCFNRCVLITSSA